MMNDQKSHVGESSYAAYEPLLFGLILSIVSSVAALSYSILDHLQIYTIPHEGQK